VSVPAGERKESRLEVFVQALDLATYTLKITKNKKIFLPEYQGALTDDIVETAKDIYIDAWMANNVRVNTEAVYETEKLKARNDWMERRRLQQRAARNCNRLLALIGMAKSIFHLRDKRIKYWTGKILTVRAMIRKWSESDDKRYSEKLG
jgi:hypothetical protein